LILVEVCLTVAHWGAIKSVKTARVIPRLDCLLDILGVDVFRICPRIFVNKDLA
jgi:hypothetical protein